MHEVEAPDADAHMKAQLRTGLAHETLERIALQFRKRLRANGRGGGAAAGPQELL